MSEVPSKQLDKFSAYAEYPLVTLISLEANKKITIPDVQRPLDSERVNEIVTFQMTIYQQSSTYCFIGPIIFYKIGDEYLLIDGQHRFAAIKELYKVNPRYIEYRMLVLIINENISIDTAFLHINSAKPVPKEIIEKAKIMRKTLIIDSFISSFRTEYRIFLSESANPKIPNINLSALQKHLHASTLDFDQTHKLIMYVKFVNDKLRILNNDTTEKAITKAVSKQKPPLFLSADREFKFLRDNALFIEFLTQYKAPEYYYNTYNSQIILPPIDKNKLWVTYVGFSQSVLCKLCNTTNITQNNFEYVLIVPISRGGCNTIQNAIPACVACKKIVGKTDLRTWCEKMGKNYTEVITPTPLLIDDFSEMSVD